MLSDLVGRTPWSARDALVPLPEAEPEGSADPEGTPRAPAPLGLLKSARLSQGHVQLLRITSSPFATLFFQRRLADPHLISREKYIISQGD